MESIEKSMDKKFSLMNVQISEMKEQNDKNADMMMELK